MVHPDGKGTWGWNENKDKDAPVRYQWRKMAGGIDKESEEDARDDTWVSTPWGRSQLTHLPGVREKLRADHEATKRAQFKMNVLAEFGPTNLDEAWMYFKHWVKGRPVKAECFPAREQNSLPGGGGDLLSPSPPIGTDMPFDTPKRVDPADTQRAYFGFQNFPMMLDREGPTVVEPGLHPYGQQHTDPLETREDAGLTGPSKWSEERHGCIPVRECDPPLLGDIAKDVSSVAAATLLLNEQMEAAGYAATALASAMFRTDAPRRSKPAEPDITELDAEEAEAEAEAEYRPAPGEPGTSRDGNYDPNYAKWEARRKGKERARLTERPPPEYEPYTPPYSAGGTRLPADGPLYSPFEPESPINQSVADIARRLTMAGAPAYDEAPGLVSAFELSEDERVRGGPWAEAEEPAWLKEARQDLDSRFVSAGQLTPQPPRTRRVYRGTEGESPKKKQIRFAEDKASTRKKDLQRAKRRGAGGLWLS